MEVLAARIHDALTKPFVVAGIELMVRASVGMAYAGPGDEISSELIARADHAMYQAKRRRGGSNGSHLYDLRMAVERRDVDRLDTTFAPLPEQDSSRSTTDPSCAARAG